MRAGYPSRVLGQRIAIPANMSSPILKQDEPHWYCHVPAEAMINIKVAQPPCILKEE